MAGDWIKMECATPDKPEVLAITASMGWDDPDLTVGKLFRVWRWFDQHTTDGNAAGVTEALLDRIALAKGFAAAMVDCGWLVLTDNGACLPKFGLHCGRTAKERAQTAKRVAAHKANADGNGENVTNSVTKSVSGALPREEKRREEKKEQKTHAASDDACVPEAFEEAWQAYPKREGSNSRRAAVKAWNARIRAGVDPAELVAGVRRYAAFCAAKGSIGTAYVKQAAVFFGPNAHWSEQWAVQADQASMQPAQRPAPPGKRWVAGLLVED